jgi:hypothetical protein
MAQRPYCCPRCTHVGAYVWRTLRRDAAPDVHHLICAACAHDWYAEEDVTESEEPRESASRRSSKRWLSCIAAY